VGDALCGPRGDNPLLWYGARCGASPARPRAPPSPLTGDGWNRRCGGTTTPRPLCLLALLRLYIFTSRYFPHSYSLPALKTTQHLHAAARERHDLLDAAEVAGRQLMVSRTFAVLWRSVVGVDGGVFDGRGSAACRFPLLRLTGGRALRDGGRGGQAL